MAKGGRRANAGRKSKAYEVSVGKIISSEMPQILIESAKHVNSFFSDPLIEKEVKAELGARFLMKAMPTNVTLEGGETPIFQLIVSKTSTPNRLMEPNEV